MERTICWFGDAAAVRAYRDGMAAAARWEAQEHPLRFRTASEAIGLSGEHRAFLVSLHGAPPNVRPDPEPWRKLFAALSRLKTTG